MTDRPLVLLDVDGPLNPYQAKLARRPAGYETHQLLPTGWDPRRPLRVWLNPYVGDLLGALVDLTGAELAWCTTWGDDANRLIAPLVGLPELPVVPLTIESSRVVDPKWKFSGALAYAGRRRPLLWFDDDFAHYPEFSRWFRDQRVADARTRLFHVPPEIGLTHDDVSSACRWLNEGREHEEDQ